PRRMEGRQRTSSRATKSRSLVLPSQHRRDRSPQGTRHPVVLRCAAGVADMSSWIVRRARVAWVLGFAVALVGSLPVLLLALRALLPGAHAAAGRLLDFVPEIPSPWLAESRLGMLLRKLAFIPAGLHGALLLALAGLGVM